MISPILPLLLALCLPVPVEETQQQGPVIFRVKSNLVLIDVQAFDRKGRFMSDLRKEDFSVFESGKEQEIVSFDLVQRGMSEERGPSARSTNIAVDSDHDAALLAPSTREGITLALLLDMNTINAQSLRRIKRALTEFFKSRLMPSDHMLLATVDKGFRLEQNFTSDAGKVLETLDSLDGQTYNMSFENELAAMVDRIENVFRIWEGSPAAPIATAVDEAATHAGNFLSIIGRNLSTSSHAINVLTDALGSLEGRKHLIFFGSGYPLNASILLHQLIEQRATAALMKRGAISLGILSSALRQQISAALGSLEGENLYAIAQQMIDGANRSQVSIYSVDVRGLVAKSGAGDAYHRGSPSLMRLFHASRFDQADIVSPQEFLNNLASGTGGLAFFNSNDLGRGIRRAYSDLHEYYLIGYQPTSKKKKGSFRKVRLKVHRPGVKIRYRKGYVDGNEKQLAHREIFNAFKYPGLFDRFPLAATLTPTSHRLRGEIQIPTSSLMFQDRGEKKSCGIEIYAALINEDGSWVGNDFFFTRGYRLNLDAKQFQALMARDNVTSTIDENIAAAGSYRLQVVVRQGPGRSIATLSHPFTIVDP